MKCIVCYVLGHSIFFLILCSASTVSFSVAEDTQSVKGGPDPSISCHIMFEESNLCEE